MVRKVVKDAVICPECKQVKERAVEETFCDYCGKQFDPSKVSIDIRLFFKKDVDLNHTDSLEFDSHACAIEWLKSKPKKFWKKVDFLTLPYIHGDEALEFLELLK